MHSRISASARSWGPAVGISHCGVHLVVNLAAYLSLADFVLLTLRLATDTHVFSGDVPGALPHAVMRLAAWDSGFELPGRLVRPGWARESPAHPDKPEALGQGMMSPGGYLGELIR